MVMALNDQRGEVSIGCIIMSLVHVTHASSLSSFQCLQIARPRSIFENSEDRFCSSTLNKL